MRNPKDADAASKMPALMIVLGLTIAVVRVGAQTTSLPSVEQALNTIVQSPDVGAFQMQQFLMSGIPALPEPSANGWPAKTVQLRHRILDEVAFHGWPREWVE